MGYFEWFLIFGMIMLPFMWYFRVISKKVFAASFGAYALCAAVLMFTSNSLISLLCAGVGFAFGIGVSLPWGFKRLLRNKRQKAVVLCDFSDGKGKILMNNREFFAVGEGNFDFCAGQVVRVVNQNDNCITVCPLRHCKR